MTTLSAEAALEHARIEMIRDQCRARGIGDERVLAAMASIARETFVPESLRDEAYADRALPVQYAQTISQPYMVALMTAALDVQKEHVVLEIGTGTGYQTAILARLARHVQTVERIPGLSHDARRRLDALGIQNVSFAIGDGSAGWPILAPYDRILITAAAPAVAPEMFEQLAIGGRLVAPVGAEDVQTLMVYDRAPDGVRERSLVQCRFVKLVGRGGWTVEE